MAWSNSDKVVAGLIWLWCLVRESARAAFPATLIREAVPDESRDFEL